MQPNDYPPTPDNSTPPSNYPPAQPQIQPSSAQRIIQPLSSEADIRAAASAAPSTPDYSSDSTSTGFVSETPDTNRQDTETEVNQDRYYNSSTLITEPLRPMSVQPSQAQTHMPSQSLVTTPIKKKRRIVVPIVVVLILAAAFTAYALFSGGRVTVSSLTEVKIQNTSYLRPRQWKAIDSRTSSYGDLRAKEGKSTQIVSVAVTSPTSTTLVNASDTVYQMLRTQVVNSLTESTFTNSSADPRLACDPGSINLQKEEDKSSTQNSVGIYKLTATCKRDHGAFLTKSRGIMGRDGSARMIIVAATQLNWDTNHEAFQKMLDSLEATTPQI